MSDDAQDAGSWDDFNADVAAENASWDAYNLQSDTTAEDAALDAGNLAVDTNAEVGWEDQAAPDQADG